MDPCGYNEIAFVNDADMISKETFLHESRQKSITLW